MKQTHSLKEIKYDLLTALKKTQEGDIEVIMMSKEIVASNVNIAILKNEEDLKIAVETVNPDVEVIAVLTSVKKGDEREYIHKDDLEDIKDRLKNPGVYDVVIPESYLTVFEH